MSKLISGIETLATFSAVLDSQEHTIHIDFAVIAMRPYTSLAQKTNMRGEAFQTDDMDVPTSTNMFAGDNLEHNSTLEANKLTI